MQVHPDHGGDEIAASKAIVDLGEARRILFRAEESRPDGRSTSEGARRCAPAGAGAGARTAEPVARGHRGGGRAAAGRAHGLPYRLAGRKAPDRPPVLLGAVRAAAAGLVERAGVAPDRLALGGRSMGGHMCSMAVADGLPAAALVLVAYPLHPPGRPDNQRTASPADRACLFVQGSGTPRLARRASTAATATIPGPVTHEWIDGGRHDLKGADRRIGELVAAWLSGLGPS